MIQNQLFRRSIFTGLLLLVAVAFDAVTWSSIVMAQGPAPFLVTPYYGTKSINSYYDHTYPLSQNQDVRYFDGRLGTTPNCDPSFNRAYQIPNGQCLYYDGHEGIDFAMYYEPVLAAASGTVTQRGWNNINDRGAGYGLFVDIQHTVNIGGQNVVYTTRYGHLSAIAVSVNSTVQTGQIIGSSGNTGNSSGAHLHFGVLNQNNQNTDPFGWTGGGTDPSGTASICLWKDGEWANYCDGMRRPIPAPVNGGQIQIDDNAGNNNGFAKGNGGYPNNICPNNCANWTLDNNMYYTLVNGNTPDSWARWQPTIPAGGAIYEILIFIPNVATNTTTWQASYTIVHSGGTTNAVIDQVGSRNNWISIGAYRMSPSSEHGVYITDASGETGTRRVGADSVKFIRRGTTYIPDFRYNDSNVWSSTITVRNNGGGRAQLNISFLQSNGTVATNCATATNTLAAHATITLGCPSTTVASAIVDSSQDVSVVVQQERSGIYTHEAYPGVDNPMTEVRVPLVHRNHSGWNSELFIQNAGNTSTNINLEFTGLAGGCILTPCVSSNQATLSPSGRARLSVTNYTVDGFYGSVRITNSANQPLAVASTQYYLNTTLLMETSNTQPPASTLYAPLLQNNNSGWLSGLTLFRSSGTGSFNLWYYNHNTGVNCSNAQNISNNPYNVYPAPPAGNSCTTMPLAQFQAGSSMVANVNQLKSNVAATTYAAITNPSRQVIVGKVWRDIGNVGWSDGFMIANYNSSQVNVTVRFYEGSTGNVKSTLAYPVGALQSINIFGAVPTNFRGSAVVIADQPVAVQVNSYYPGGDYTTRDVIGSYPATHR